MSFLANLLGGAKNLVSKGLKAIGGVAKNVVNSIGGIFKGNGKNSSNAASSALASVGGLNNSQTGLQVNPNGALGGLNTVASLSGPNSVVFDSTGQLINPNNTTSVNASGIMKPLLWIGGAVAAVFGVKTLMK